MGTKAHWDRKTPLTEYEEHHFQNIEDVGVAWNGNRVWVCINGQSLLRAKVVDNELYIEFYPRGDENG